MEVQPREIKNYIKADGKIPFEDWYLDLKDKKARQKIRLRIDRAKLGNLGDYRSVGKGVFEFKIDCGPGYRVYFGQIGTSIVLLLCGGDKSTQEKDILKAQEYWKDYEKRESSNQ
jgi:putative addiction module killer protein